MELHAGPRPIFDLHGIEEEINRALERKVPLKSGGYLVIDQTESMTTIDVNTGGFVGHRNLEDTIFRTNLEAAVAIARQLAVDLWRIFTGAAKAETVGLIYLPEAV
mgnify:CR=1 FL=1